MKSKKNKSFNSQQNIENLCPSLNSTFINNSSIEQTQNTASCSQELKEIKTFQKMNGFYKSETTSNDKNWNTNVSGNVVAKPSIKAGIPFIAEGKIEVEVEVGIDYTLGGSQTYTIEDNSNSSDTEIKTNENNINITIPSESVKIPPNSKISISDISWKNNIKLILNYYQKIEGIVSADFVDKDNNKTTISISIKEAMLFLQEKNILPSKIGINNDNSINFYYDIESLKQIIMHQTEIGKSIPLS